MYINNQDGNNAVCKKGKNMINLKNVTTNDIDNVLDLLDDFMTNYYHGVRLPDFDGNQERLDKAIDILSRLGGQA